MRNLLPGRKQLAILVGLAGATAVGAVHLHLSDGWMIPLTFPLVLAAMLMGAWRGGKLG